MTGDVITVEEMVRRTAGDPDWDWETCGACGAPATTRGLVLLSLTVRAGQLKRIGWCDSPECVADREATDVLVVVP